jgi:hypothetical protein
LLDLLGKLEAATEVQRLMTWATPSKCSGETTATGEG